MPRVEHRSYKGSPAEAKRILRKIFSESDLDRSDVGPVQRAPIHDGDLWHVPQQAPLPFYEGHVSHNDDMTKVSIGDV